MENYIGKICPFCKTEIKEGEEIKVCPACGIPHHEGCWEENRGCTTFGCSGQHYEIQGTNPTEVCSKCGAPLGDGQAFCPKCGTPKISRQTNCGKCGTPLTEGQKFCAKCGQKVGVMFDSNLTANINQYNATINQTAKKKKKAPIIIAILLVVCLSLFGGFYGIREHAKQELKDKLMDTKWHKNSGSLTLYLDFSSDEVEYSSYGTYTGKYKFGDYSYEVIDGNTIKIRGQKVKVYIDDDSVTFSPSFVNSDSYSTWYD